MLLWFIFQGFSLYANQQVRYCAKNHHRNKVMDLVHHIGEDFHFWVYYSFKLFLKSTCKYVCMCQDACFPSLTASTVVLARPATSPPANTHGSLVCMLSGSTSGSPHLFNLMGAMASITAEREREREKTDKGKGKFMRGKRQHGKRPGEKEKPDRLEMARK